MTKNRNVIPEAKAAIDQFKYEIANETGIPIEKDHFNEMTSSQ